MNLKRSSVVRGVIIIGLAPGSFGCRHDVMVIHTSAPMVMSRARCDRIQSRCFELLESCCYENDAAIANDEVWKQHAERHHLTFTFAEPREARVLGETLRVTALMVPASVDQPPPHLFVRCDDRVRAFCKYAPREWAALQAELGWGGVDDGHRNPP